MISNFDLWVLEHLYGEICELVLRCPYARAGLCDGRKENNCPPNN